MTFHKILIAVCLILCISIVRPSAAQDSTQDVPAEDVGKKGFASKFKDRRWLVRCEPVVG